MDWASLGVGTILGAGLGLVWGFWQKSKSELKLTQQIADLEKEKVVLVATQEAETRRQLDLQKNLESFQTSSTQKFELLAQRIFTEQSSQFRDQGERQLKLLLDPVKERLRDFEKKVEETYQSESRERFSLKNEIQRIAEMNQKMSQETEHLTQALRGDVKTQGRWGELVLERILERSGLRKDHEYVTQGEGMGLKSAAGTTEKPDVIIRLPDNKHIIIDSKVSLTAYDRMVGQREGAPERVQAQKDFITSLYRHIDGLSQKHYHLQEKLNCPDFVLLFVPTESSFATACQLDSELFGYAWDKRIVLVSPTTLLATLRTVESIWKQENQNRNALEIARQGGALYDKFVAFVEDLEDVGRHIDRVHTSYTTTMSKLRDGKGNLIRRAESLRELGAKTSKQLTQIDSEGLESSSPSS